ncbi:MAG: polysaccharide deacetylase family protein [Clostridiales bacterium]|nr:polysaccharide deacetylase family protein [Clostridiales bacterium]
MAITEEQEKKAIEYLESGSRQERERRRKRMLRKRRKQRNMILLMIFLILFFITGIVVFMAYMHTNVYQDEEEFRDYVDKQLETGQIFEAQDQIRIEYEYGSPISYAVDYDIYDNKDITGFRDEKIDIIKKNFKAVRNAEEKERKAEHGTEFRYRPLEQALIVSSRVFESENGVVSLAIYEQDDTEEKKDMQTVSTRIYTYQFSGKTGNRLSSYQIFTEDYRKKCESYFTEFFSKEYDKDQLRDGWEKYLSADETHYNDFIITDTGVVFFFEEGTVVNAEEGVVSAGIPEGLFAEVMRPEIKERYVDPSKPMVAITYDDGPGGKAENRILNCLRKNGAVATFFYLGNRISGDTVTVRKAFEMGCEIGNHTWDHPVLTNLKEKQVKRQIKKTNEAIKKACGAEPTLFRPSYGETSSTVNELSGLPVVMWTVDTLDWQSRNAKKVFKEVKKAGNLDGDIILMHSIYDSTARATEMIVPYLKKKGYQLVTVSELIKYRYDEQPGNGKIYR